MLWMRFQEDFPSKPLVGGQAGGRAPPPPPPRPPSLPFALGAAAAVGFFDFTLPRAAVSADTVSSHAGRSQSSISFIIAARLLGRPPRLDAVPSSPAAPSFFILNNPCVSKMNSTRQVAGQAKGQWTQWRFRGSWLSCFRGAFDFRLGRLPPICSGFCHFSAFYELISTRLKIFLTEQGSDALWPRRICFCLTLFACCDTLLVDLSLSS